MWTKLFCSSKSDGLNQTASQGPKPTDPSTICSFCPSETSPRWVTFCTPNPFKAASWDPHCPFCDPKKPLDGEREQSGFPTPPAVDPLWESMKFGGLQEKECVPHVTPSLGGGRFFFLLSVLGTARNQAEPRSGQKGSADVRVCSIQPAKL